MFPPFATFEAIVVFRTPNETGKLDPRKPVTVSTQQNNPRLLAPCLTSGGSRSHSGSSHTSDWLSWVTQTEANDQQLEKTTDT